MLNFSENFVLTCQGPALKDFEGANQDGMAVTGSIYSEEETDEWFVRRLSECSSDEMKLGP